MTQSTVAVIMPAFNAAKYLRQCIASFQEQTYNDWHLYCVDRGSTDGTLEILNDFASKWEKLTVLNGGNERTSQINVGVRSSQSTYIYYTASDFIVDKKLLEDAVGACEAMNADGAWINCHSYGDGFWARVRNLERTTYFGSEKFEGVRFFRRDAYLRVGGYDDDVPIFEEYDLQDRLLRSGARLTRITASAEYHLGEPESLREIATKSYYYGTKYIPLLEKQGGAALRHVNPVRSTFFRQWKSFARSPVLTAGFFVMLAVKYGSGGAGALSVLIARLMKPAPPR
jgi:glycosyltransferase involved in cell wall biosynthesis